MGYGFLLGKRKVFYNYEDEIDGNIYGVRIQNNFNPETSVTYIDDAEGSAPARGNNGNFNFGSWENRFPFNKIRPCLFKNGTVVGYLNPNDYSKFVDGTPSNNHLLTPGDTMIEIPKVYWKFEKEGTDILVRYSQTKIDDSYKALAHTKNGVEKDFIYIGAYEGSQGTSSQLRSVSKATVLNNQILADYRTFAENNGSGYGIFNFYQITLIQVLYMVMFKNRNSQVALGKGNVVSSTGLVPGGADTKGMYYGTTLEDNHQIKLFGIEDVYGNYEEYIDGIMTNSTRDILTATDNFNNSGTGYTVYTTSVSSNAYGYITRVDGRTETGFTPIIFGGSASSYYADQGEFYSNRYPKYGGARTDGEVGIFAMNLNKTATARNTTTASRLVYV